VTPVLLGTPQASALLPTVSPKSVSPKALAQQERSKALQAPVPDAAPAAVDVALMALQAEVRALALLVSTWPPLPHVIAPLRDRSAAALGVLMVAPVSCSVSEKDIISISTLTSLGWSFVFTSDTVGSRAITPSSGEFPLRQTEEGFYLDLIKGDTLGFPAGSVTVRNGRDSSHALLRVFPFLVVSGASTSV
jgi:hypothetical protein